MIRSRKFLLFGPATGSDSVAIADVLRQETVGGVLLLIATVVSLVWANLAGSGYLAMQHLSIGPLDLQHWAADGLLAIFFFVAGLELKRELAVGSLSRPSEALVPIVAALCGMAVPAGLYLAVNLAVPGGHPDGWAIPMATDIAFALAVLAVAGRSLPPSLRAFLLTLAIVDDLGAIIVLAIAFTDHLNLWWLLAGLGCVGGWLVLQRFRARGWYIYIPLALLCWFCVHEGGVHATIAGVALGLATRAPRRSQADTSEAEESKTAGSSSGKAHHDDAPLDHWEHLWRPVSAAVAVPVFALVSAGVTLTPSALGAVFTSPAPIGIMVGLILGKSLGVFGGAYLTAHLTRAELAADLRWRDVFAVSVLAGIGFTVALLIAELAFESDVALADQTKAAVLIASVAAALLAVVLLRRRSAARELS